MTRSQLLLFAQILYEADANRSKPAWADLGDGTKNLWIERVKPTQARKNDDYLRKLWRDVGGSFHGPNVETGTMPEKDLLPFLRLILYRG